MWRSEAEARDDTSRDGSLGVIQNIAAPPLASPCWRLKRVSDSFPSRFGEVHDAYAPSGVAGDEDGSIRREPDSCDVVKLVAVVAAIHSVRRPHLAGISVDKLHGLSSHGC